MTRAVSFLHQIVLAPDEVLAPLGLRQGELVGWLGEVEVYRVAPAGTRPGPPGDAPDGDG